MKMAVAALALVVALPVSMSIGHAATANGHGGVRGNAAHAAIAAGRGGPRGGAFRGGGYRGGFRGYRGGYGGYYGPGVGLYFGAPLYDPYWDYYSPYYYAPYGYSYPPPAAYPDDYYDGGAPADDEQAGPEPVQNWYYCDDPQGYYPDVRSCNHQWQPVPATPPPAPPNAR